MTARDKEPALDRPLHDVEGAYVRYRRPLLGFCGRQFDNRIYSVDDLVQDTFTRFVSAYADSFTEIDNVFAVLARIARNLFLNRRRELRMGTKSPVILEQFRDAKRIAVGPGLDERLVLGVENSHLLRVIGSLPVDASETLDAYLHDRTYQDIAAERGVSVGKVQKDLQRALDALGRTYGLNRKLDPKIFRQTVDYGSNRETYRAAVKALMKYIDTVLDEGPDEPRAKTQALLAEKETRHRALLNWCTARAMSDPLAANVVFSYAAARTFMQDFDDWDSDLSASLKPYVRAAARFASGRDDKWKVLPLDAIVSSLTGDLAATKAATLAAMLHPPQSISLAANHHRRVEGIAKSLPASDQIDILEQLLACRSPESRWLKWLAELYLDVGAADLTETVLEEFERQADLLVSNPFNGTYLDTAYDDSTERWKDGMHAQIATMRGEFALAEQLSTPSAQRLKVEYDHLPRLSQEELASVRCSLHDPSPSGSPTWAVRIGQLYAALNEPASAVRHFTYALDGIGALEKSDPRVEWSGPSSRLHGWALYWRARAHRMLGDAATAFDDAEAAVRILRIHGRDEARHATNLVRLLEYERDATTRGDVGTGGHAT